jgi:hypothetical protein
VKSPAVPPDVNYSYIKQAYSITLKGLTASLKKWGIEGSKEASEKLSAVPTYLSTSSTKREKLSHSAGRTSHAMVWFTSGIEVLYVVEFVKNVGNSDPNEPS